MQETMKQLEQAIAALLAYKVKDYTTQANLRLLRGRLKTARRREGKEK